MSSNPSLNTSLTICALPGCDSPVVQPSPDGRPRLYCRAEHRLEARRLRREGRRAGADGPAPEQPGSVPPSGPVPAVGPVPTRAGLVPLPRSPAGPPRPAAARGHRVVVRRPAWVQHHPRVATALFAVVSALAAMLAVPPATHLAVPGSSRSIQAAPQAGVPATGVTGLHAALWQGFVTADQALPENQQQAAAVRSARRLLETASTNIPSTSVGEALVQLRRREAALAQNGAMLRRQVDAWTSYVRIHAQYTAASQELALVDQAVRALQALPERDTLAGVRGALAGLTARKAELQRSLRNNATTLDRLLFVDLGRLVEPPPMPALPDLPGTAASPQRVAVSWASSARVPGSVELAAGARAVRVRENRWES
jgi:hypothetical protein